MQGLHHDFSYLFSYRFLSVADGDHDTLGQNLTLLETVKLRHVSIGTVRSGRLGYPNDNDDEKRKTFRQSPSKRERRPLDGADVLRS